MLISSSVATTLIVSKLTWMKKDTGARRLYNLLPNMQPPSQDVVLKATKCKEQLVEVIVNKVKTDTEKSRNMITVIRKDLSLFIIANRSKEEWADLMTNQEEDIWFWFIKLHQIRSSSSCISFPLVILKWIYWCYQHLLILIKWLVSLEPIRNILLSCIASLLLMSCLDAIQWVFWGDWKAYSSQCLEKYYSLFFNWKIELLSTIVWDRSDQTFFILLQTNQS